jgi:cysteinyl-tRNA synthetase
MLWDSPWGKGFPGWHIECSAMSLKHLTKAFETGKFEPEKVNTIDIHTGGEDLVFPHHEDEIAQSEGASGKSFVKLWFHGGHLTVDGKKMARSANNFYTLSEIESKGVQPLSFRYLALTAHYRSRLNFTWDGLSAAQTALNNLYREVSGYGESGEVNKEFEAKFHSSLNNDLDTPTALTIVWEVVKSSLPAGEKLATLIKFDEVLGLGFEEQAKLDASEEVNNLLAEREKARQSKDFARSDEIRKQIADKGFEVVDTDTGPKLKKIIQ